MWCSYADEVGAGDVVFDEDGVKVIVDAEALRYVDGTQIDFVREGLNEAFKFRNRTSRVSAAAARASRSNCPSGL
jgi:iron-sulfur cluster assembly protein